MIFLYHPPEDLGSTYEQVTIDAKYHSLVFLSKIVTCIFRSFQHTCFSTSPLECTSFENAKMTVCFKVKTLTTASASLSLTSKTKQQNLEEMIFKGLTIYRHEGHLDQWTRTTGTNFCSPYLWRHQLKIRLNQTRFQMTFR